LGARKNFWPVKIDEVLLYYKLDALLVVIYFVSAAVAVDSRHMTAS